MNEDYRGQLINTIEKYKARFESAKEDLLLHQTKHIDIDFINEMHGISQIIFTEKLSRYAAVIEELERQLIEFDKYNNSK